MKILCASLWENTWIPYWTKYLESRGHEVKWLIGFKCSKEIASEFESWADAILCHWAVGWAHIFSKTGNKPLYIIHRSFECFNDVGTGLYIKDIEWKNVTKLFILNQSHFDLIRPHVNNVQPSIIKNGIDIDEWTIPVRTIKSLHNIAWVANLNHKKGEMLAAHAIAQIQKIDPLVQLHHIGKCNSSRIDLYLKHIAPYMNSLWVSYGHNNSHEFVRNILSNTRYILSSSLVEGHPMNILEAMSMGCKPLIHRYPGVEYQFPEKYIWTTFDDLIRLYEEPYAPEEYRQYIVDTYDYRIAYEPVALAIEDAE